MMQSLVRRATTAIFLVALAFPAVAGDLVVSGLQVAWPEGYERAADESPARIAGPDGVTVLITVWGSRGFPPTDGVQRQQAFVQVVSKRLPELAAAAGDIAIPLQEEALASGSTLVTTGSRSAKEGLETFFLQYVLAAPSGMAALITVEGTGDVHTQHRRFSPLVRAGTWQHAR